MSTISTLGQNDFIRSQIQRIQKQMDALSNQVSSGKKAQTFSGINNVTQLSLQLNDQVSLTQAYITNIDNAQTRITPMQAVLQRITDIANQLRNDALVASSPASLPTAKGNSALKAEAEQALNEIGTLLNTKVGNDYLFGGRNTNTPPMSSFGSTANASSLLGQAQTAAATATPSGTLVSADGDSIYNAITSFLANYNGTRAGTTVPMPYGYAGETAQPGGSAYTFTSSGALAVGATTVTVNQGFDLPQVGQFIEFAVTPPTNASYRVTAVNTTTRTITFARQDSSGAALPSALTGVDSAIPAGTAINVASPSVVTSVSVSATQTTGATTYQSPTVTVAAGATSLTMSNAADFSVGQTFQIDRAGTTYTISNVDTTNNTITFTPPLAAGVTSGTNLVTPGNMGTSGSTQMLVRNGTQYTVGDRISFASAPTVFYNVTAVNGDVLSISGAPSGGGLASTIAPTDTIIIDHGYAPGTNIITLGSVSGVTAGMSVKFSDSNVTYTVTAVDTSNSQITIVPEGTLTGTGLAVPLYAPEQARDMEVTASFGAPVTALSATIDSGVSLQYGIRADNPAFRTVFNAIFALATTVLNGTTDDGYREVATRAAADLAQGSQDVTTLASTLGVKQQTLQATEDRHKSFMSALQTQLSNVQDVDMTEAITTLTQVQTQLQASFQLLSTLKGLTLANYL